jgi:hypothetical protein
VPQTFDPGALSYVWCHSESVSQLTGRSCPRLLFPGGCGPLPDPSCNNHHHMIWCGNTYPTLRPITQCRVPLPIRLELALGAPRRPWMVNRGVTFQEPAAVPAPHISTWVEVAAPQQVSDSVGDVLGVRRGKPTVSKEPGAPRSHWSKVQTSFKSVLSLRSLSSTWPGGVDLKDGCYLLWWSTTSRLSAYHRLP